MQSDSVPESVFYEAVGRGIGAWQQLEDKLTNLFTRLLICEFHGTMLKASFNQLWIAGNILNSITNVGARLDLVDATFLRVVEDVDLQVEWKTVRNKIRDKYKWRNALAHGTVWGNETGIDSLGSPMFSSRDQSYPASSIAQWEQTFLNLAKRTEDLSIAVNRHLAARLAEPAQGV